MVDALPVSLRREPVAVLLHPSMVPIIDVFRSLSCLDDQYDLALLDGPEQALTDHTSPETAKGIISDALLLAFALTRQRGRPFAHRPLGSRHANIDEYCLLVLIASAHDPSSDVTLEAAAFLEVVSLDFMRALAGELIRQIGLGALAFQPPALPDFKAIVGSGGTPDEVLIEAALSRAEFSFRN